MDNNKRESAKQDFTFFFHDLHKSRAELVEASEQMQVTDSYLYAYGNPIDPRNVHAYEIELHPKAFTIIKYLLARLPENTVKTDGRIDDQITKIVVILGKMAEAWEDDIPLNESIHSLFADFDKEKNTLIKEWIKKDQ